MALRTDISNKVNSYFDEPYKVETTTIVPDTDYSKLTFGNKGLTSELAFLYVDIRKSSELHNTYGYADAARIYQSFHEICVRIINHNNGKIRSFDGDRVMGVFSGKSKCTSAVKSAMNIRYCVDEFLSKKLKTPIEIGCGIDFGKILIIKVGKGRDENNKDLVWVGQASNYAAHLSGYGNNSIIISRRTYDRMHCSVKWKDEHSKEVNMWRSKNLTIKNNKQINVCTSNYYWGI